MESNFRFRARQASVEAPPFVVEETECSSSARSSSESGANLKLGLERSLGTRLVTYADDLVILCRSGSNPWSYSLPWLADLVRSRFANKGLRRPIHPYGRALPQG
jgi:hypothetical protein